MNIVTINCRAAAYAQVKEIRRRIFIEEQGVAPAEEQDEYDEREDTHYVLVLDGGKAVATGRIIYTEKGLKIGRIAVLRELRGTGLGKTVVEALQNEALTMGAKEIYVHAQLHAVEFYKRLGFELLSDEVIVESGLKHLPMRKVLNG